MTVQRADLRRRARDLQALLREWDPIGVGSDAPADEYDCLVWPVMRRLMDGIPAPELAAFLATQLEEHFGLSADSVDTAGFAARAKNWFDAAARR